MGYIPQVLRDSHNSLPMEYVRVAFIVGSRRVSFQLDSVVKRYWAL